MAGDNSKAARFIRVGTWGRESGGLDNQWSFELLKDHKLVKITIDHGNHVIYSLMFTTKSRGVFGTYKAGGLAGYGETVSEVMLDGDEELIEIKGTIGHTIISSLYFRTTKCIHGPFGRETETVFSVPLDKGSLVGFYGIAGDYIDSIGVYLKATEEIVRVGTWGRTHPGDQQFVWSFQLERKHHLNMIIIDHGDLIYSLMFITKFGGLTSNSERFGGRNAGGYKVSVVAFDWNEEINGIYGTVALSRGKDSGYTVISSISFVTNKKTHGPYGTVRGTHFKLLWGDSSFAGFYGLCGRYIDSIGVYLKAAK